MNIPFMQTWPDKMGKELAGKPTYFIDQIWDGLGCNLDDQEEFIYDYAKIFGISWDKRPYYFNPKIHTIRENKKCRYKAGVILHPYVWTGKPYHSSPFYFCPKIECVSTQRIEMRYAGDAIVVDVEGNQFFYWGEEDYNPKLDILAQNDGFKSTDDFFKWFDSDFTGSIIHWTDLKY